MLSLSLSTRYGTLFGNTLTHAPAAFPDLDHFADVSKMILNTMPAIETRHL